MEPAGPRSPPAPAFLVACLLAAAAVGFSLLVVGQGSWCDDAFISFRYARNLFEGNGLVFNPGKRAEGYTNFLWCLLVAPFPCALGDREFKRGFLPDPISRCSVKYAPKRESSPALGDSQ